MLCIIVPEYESADDEQATATENDREPTTDEEDEPTDGDRFLRTGC
jgi:hypothetical protein